jgi:hypothetical protein
MLSISVKKSNVWWPDINSKCSILLEFLLHCLQYETAAGNKIIPEEERILVSVIYKYWNGNISSFLYRQMGSLGRCQLSSSSPCCPTWRGNEPVTNLHNKAPAVSLQWTKGLIDDASCSSRYTMSSDGLISELSSRTIIRGSNNALI